MNHEQIAKHLSDGIDAALFEQYGAEWKRRAEQAERDRDTLATEVTAWRDADDSHELLDAIDVCDVYGHRHAVENAQKEVDASGALARAK